MNDQFVDTAPALPSIVAAVTAAGVELARASTRAGTTVWELQPMTPTAWLTLVREFNLDPNPMYSSTIEAAGFVAGHAVTAITGAAELARTIQFRPAVPALIDAVRDAVAAPTPVAS